MKGEELNGSGLVFLLESIGFEMMRRSHHEDRLRYLYLFLAPREVHVVSILVVTSTETAHNRSFVPKRRDAGDRVLDGAKTNTSTACT